MASIVAQLGDKKSLSAALAKKRGISEYPVQFASQKPTLSSVTAADRHVNEKIHLQNGQISEDARILRQ